MALNLTKDKGTPLELQKFTWRELVQKPTSKLNDDAFTRVRVILMNGIESEATVVGLISRTFASNSTRPT